MFCIDAEYVLVFLCSVFLLVYTVAERHKANIKKLVAISAIHSFVFISSTVYCLLFSGCKISKFLCKSNGKNPYRLIGISLLRNAVWR